MARLCKSPTRMYGVGYQSGRDLGHPTRNAAKYPAVKVAPVFSKFDRKTLELMAEAVRDGKLVIPISETLPLRQAAEAQATAEKGVAGKILLVA